jgi:hypothetical protein
MGRAGNLAEGGSSVGENGLKTAAKKKGLCLCETAAFWFKHLYKVWQTF